MKCFSLEHLAQKLGSEIFRLTKSASGHNEAVEVSLTSSKWRTPHYWFAPAVRQLTEAEMTAINVTNDWFCVIRQGFRTMGAKIEKLDPVAAMKDISKTVTTLMGKKVAAVKRLVETAEELTKAYEWDPEINVRTSFPPCS